MREKLNARDAWLVLGLAITVYELACPPSQTLSEGVDRALDRHRLLTSVAIGITALHLVNVLPQPVDPFTQGLKLLKR